MSSSTFTQIRAQALNLEKQTDSLLSRYSKFQNSNISTNPSDEEKELLESIKQVLDKRDKIINTLSRVADSDTELSTSKIQQLQRHKEILNEHRRSFLKIESVIDNERKRTNLLFSVRSDISAHKQRVTSSSYNEQLNANDYILEESVRADNANSFADRLLRSAYQTRDELLSQRQSLTNAQSRIFNSVSAIPGINVIISRINTRRKRDTLILASLISFCIIFLMFVT